MRQRRDFGPRLVVCVWYPDVNLFNLIISVVSQEILPVADVVMRDATKLQLAAKIQPVPVIRGDMLCVQH